MKKIISLTLAVIMLAAALAGCTTLKKLPDGTYDKGAVIEMYFSGEVYNFDPQISITDENMLKVMSLLFEGLTRINSKGKWEKALMKDYKVKADDRDGYCVIITLNHTRWSDGRSVQAIDFVNSWKRILDPNNACEAASLLYDLKNAREIKRGDAGISVDDLGASAIDTYTLKLTFKNDSPDLDRFFRNTASIALVPLREDIIAMYGDKWAMRTTSICTNGPFVLREADKGGVLRLERSGFYYRDPEKDKYADKYVIPYRLRTDYSRGDGEAQVKAYENEEIFFLGDLPLSKRAEYKNSAKVNDMMVTHTYFFNTENKVLNKAEVRRALSLAIDREKVAEILTFAQPAVGYIPYGVSDTSAKSSFRSAGEDLIATKANTDEAKKLLSSAGVRGGSFSITVRENSEADIAVAEYVAGEWNKLGFDVDVKKVGTSRLTVTDGDLTVTYTVDDFEDQYNSGDFDVIAVDMSMLSSDAFSALSQFADEFSGRGVDMTPGGGYEIFKHVTGYSDSDYNDLIDRIDNETYTAARAELLHEAEKKLLQDMPVCPIVFLQSAYVSNKILSGFKVDRFGLIDFKRVKMKNYMNYKTLDEEEETAAGDETD